jgi:uncharacterized protein YeaO (DUF488 family)
MPTPAAKAGQPHSNVVVPDEVRAKFPDLIPLVLASESMNDEERQYWVNILPIMTPEQVQNLRDILENERRQLSAIDSKYAKEIQQIGQEEFVRQMDAARQQRVSARTTAEKSSKKEEDAQTDALLKEIEGK